MDYDDRICKTCPRGKHITLVCVNHPGKIWNTKNIGYIGARTIFYNLYNDSKMGPECACPLKDLKHDCSIPLDVAAKVMNGEI